MLQKWGVEDGESQAFEDFGWMYICFEIVQVKLLEECLKYSIVLVTSELNAEDEYLGINLRYCFQYLHLEMESHILFSSCRKLNNCFPSLKT